MRRGVGTPNVLGIRFGNDFEQGRRVFANFLIGLREGLEAALVVGILLAYIHKSGRRELAPRIWAGVAIAVSVSLAFGALLTYGPRGLSFRAQETIGGTLSIIAVGFVTWMIFWMARTARSLRGELEHRIDAAVAAGGSALVLVAVLAVGREGLETALFLWAAAQATGSSTEPLIGATLGLAVAVLIGMAIYRGALKLNMARFFTWTGALLVLVAGGVLAYGIHDLQEADVLPGLNRLAFDVSSTIRPGTWVATLLKGTFNFSPTTTWLEAGAWLLYVIPVMTAFLTLTRRRPNTPARITTKGQPA
jgi:high-affinity iron transporter